MKNQTYHYIPEEETFAKRLNVRLEACKEAIIASAFFTFGAFQQFKPSLESALVGGAKIKFLLGRFDFVTEPKAIKGLLSLASKYPNQLFVYFDSDFGFHYKLARFKNAKESVMFIGSSNLTPKGLASAGEVNLEIINNADVFEKTGEILNGRIQVALDAEKYLNEYRVKYNRAKKYRAQRLRWYKSGNNKLTGKRKSKRINWAEPLGDEFKLCWIDDDEQDKTLNKNIQKMYKKVSSEISFPNQWVHINNKMESRGYQEGLIFTVLDDLDNSIGFARCTKNIRVMDRNGKEEPVIFYKYLSGWHAKFEKEAYPVAIKKLGLRGSPESIGKIVSTRLKKLLKENRKPK